ncbi:MAG TPA: hypothetical protein PKI62_16770 [bacterium]|nr:hypothetical protein [bacterium]HPR89648.1 hypothetical protein [bacterium]
MQLLFDTPRIGQQQRVRPVLQDPALVMSAASRRAGKWFALLEQQHHITAAEVMDYLAAHEPAVREKLDMLRDTVDTDVCRRYLEGVLDHNEYRHWRRTLHEWLTLLHAAVALVRLRLGVEESDFALPQEHALQQLHAGAASAAA